MIEHKIRERAIKCAHEEFMELIAGGWEEDDFDKLFALLDEKNKKTSRVNLTLVFVGLFLRAIDRGEIKVKAEVNSLTENDDGGVNLYEGELQDNYWAEKRISFYFKIDGKNHELILEMEA